MDFQAITSIPVEIVGNSNEHVSGTLRATSTSINLCFDRVKLCCNFPESSISRSTEIQIHTKQYKWQFSGRKISINNSQSGEVYFVMYPCELQCKNWFTMMVTHIKRLKVNYEFNSEYEQSIKTMIAGLQNLQCIGQTVSHARKRELDISNIFFLPKRSCLSSSSSSSPIHPQIANRTPSPKEKESSIFLHPPIQLEIFNCFIEEAISLPPLPEPSSPLLPEWVEPLPMQSKYEVVVEKGIAYDEVKFRPQMPLSARQSSSIPFHSLTPIVYDRHLLKNNHVKQVISIVKVQTCNGVNSKTNEHPIVPKIEEILISPIKEEVVISDNEDEIHSADNSSKSCNSLSDSITHSNDSNPNVDNYVFVCRDDPANSFYLPQNVKLPTKREIEVALEKSPSIRKYLYNIPFKTDDKGRKIVNVLLGNGGALTIDLNTTTLTFDGISIPEPVVYGNVIKHFFYKPSPECKAQPMDNSALLTLNPGVYVIDYVINFYFLYLKEVVMSEDMRSRSHVFLSFFYSKMSDAMKKTNISRSDRHKELAGWTRRIDIFSKDFIFIPVVQNAHWFLCIICFPWLCGTVDYDQRYDRGSANDHDTSLNIDDPAVCPALRQLRKQRLEKLKSQGIEPMPCIMVFDSLIGNSQRKVNVDHIRAHLQDLWDFNQAKKFGHLPFNKSTVRGYVPIVTHQTNGYDCGPYCLAYAEHFITTPLKKFSKGELTRIRISPDYINGRKFREDIQRLIIEEYKKTLPRS